MPKKEHNFETKKQKIVMLIGLLTLLIAVLGATFAYFQINIDKAYSNTTIIGKTPPKILATLKQITDSLHLNISASDMSQGNATKEYYGTDVEEKAYEENEEDGTKTIAEVELTGGEVTTKYSCTAKLTVSKVTEPEATEEEKDTMIDVLTPGDMILQFKGNIISDKLDLSELKNIESKEYDLNFIITGNVRENIQAYIKLINRDIPQNYLASKKLNIDININNLKCEQAGKDPKIAQLRENDPQNKLSSELVGGMYRFQGNNTDEINNYVCFGTDNKDDCINEETGIDKYMYRIIGITEEGELYLLKMRSVKEGENKKFVWHSKYWREDCGGDECEWPNVDIYKRLNGENSNGNPVFINNSEYEYMKEGNSWYDKIEYHNWMYGDVSAFISTTDLDGETVYGADNNGLIIYDIETGAKPTQIYDIVQNKYVKYQWNDEKYVNAKIGLMYLHDYYLAYDNERNWYSDYDTSNWLLLNNNETDTDISWEWLLSRRDIFPIAGYYDAWYLYSDGGVNYNSFYNLYYEFAIRPTFFLKSTVKIKKGNGSLNEPYILS